MSKKDKYFYRSPVPEFTTATKREETENSKEETDFGEIYDRFYKYNDDQIPYAWKGYSNQRVMYHGSTPMKETHLTVETTGTFHTDYTVPKEFPIEVPSKVLLVCMALAKKDEHNEFGIILKGSMTDNGYIVSEDLLIPEQKVSGASVDFDNSKLLEYRQQGYNTVIHFHPMKLTKFSGTDDDYINTNFDCSILFCDYEFSDSVINLTVGNVKIQVKGKVNVKIDGIEVDTSKIQKGGNGYGV